MDFISNYFNAYYIQRQAGVSFIVFQILVSFGISLIFFEDFLLSDSFAKTNFHVNKILQYALKFVLISAVIYCITFLLSSLFHLVIVKNNLSFYCLNYFSYAPILLGCCFFAKKEKMLERFARAFALYNSFTVAPTLSRFISFVCSSEVYGFNFEFFDTFFCVLFIFAVFSFLYVLNSEKFKNQNYTSIFLLCLIQTLILLASSLNDPSFSTTEKLKIKHIVIFAGLYCASLFIYLFHYVRHKSQEKSLEIQRKALIQKNQNEILELSMENKKQIQAMEEGMNKQYRMMASLLEKEDYDKLKQYFADLSETSFVSLTFVDCGNNAISCIMNMEIAKAKKEGINIHHSILVPKGDIGIDEYDLCSFFANIIDNAIEGVARNKISNDKNIYVNITYKKPYLISEVINPTDLKKDDLKRAVISTSKDDIKIHGYGHKIIDSIARKYGDGIVKYSIENGKFTVSSMLLGGKG